MARNLLLGGGESLVSTSEISRGGNKTWPYSIDQVRQRVLPELNQVQASISSLPPNARPRSEGVFEVTLHPAFLSRSYYPVGMLESSGLRDVGSRESIIVPEHVTNIRDAGKELATATLYVAGNDTAISTFKNLLMGQTNRPLRRLEIDFKKIESIGFRSGTDKIIGITSSDTQRYKFEVALHAGSHEEDIVAAFSRYAKSHNGNHPLS